MICEKFSNLSTRDKVLFIGELTHSCMNDDEIYNMGVAIIKIATTKGLFDNVKIMPDQTNDDSKN